MILSSYTTYYNNIYYEIIIAVLYVVALMLSMLTLM